MSQFVHLLTFFGTSIPADLWMPSNSTVPPQFSDIYSVGMYRDVLNKNLEISVEAYYKKSKNLIEYKSGYNIFSSSEYWTSAIEQNGTGESKGVEFLLQRKFGKLSGWVSYTLSSTTRQFANINGGKSYPYTYDARHDFSVVSNYKLKDKLTLSATWSYMSGRAITIPNERYTAPLLILEHVQNGLPVIDYRTAGSYEQKNNIRMSPYHRLDVALVYKKHKKRSDRILSIGFYNLYNRQNATYYYLDRKETVDVMGRPTGSSQIAVYQRSMFPIIPSISYTWVW